MIEQLTFIDELKKIKQSLGVNTDNATYNLIDTIQRKWEKQVKDFEKAVAPVVPDEPLLVTVYAEQSENK